MKIELHLTRWSGEHPVEKGQATALLVREILVDGETLYMESGEACLMLGDSSPHFLRLGLRYHNPSDEQLHEMAQRDDSLQRRPGDEASGWVEIALSDVRLVYDPDPSEQATNT